MHFGQNLCAKTKKAFRGYRSPLPLLRGGVMACERSSKYALCEKKLGKTPTRQCSPTRPPRPRRGCRAMSQGAFGGRERLEAI